MNEATRIDETANAYVVKPTPAEFFTYRAPGAREMQWGRLTASDPVVANPHFYIHNRQPPPQVEVGAWQMMVMGSAIMHPRTFTYAELRALPAVSLVRAADCAANGRRFFPKLAPQDTVGAWLPVAGSEWRFGAMGVAAVVRDAVRRRGARP